MFTTQQPIIIYNVCRTDLCALVFLYGDYHWKTLGPTQLGKLDIDSEVGHVIELLWLTEAVTSICPQVTLLVNI